MSNLGEIGHKNTCKVQSPSLSPKNKVWVEERLSNLHIPMLNSTYNQYTL